MAERLYTHDEFLAGLCIIEEMMAPTLPDAPKPWLPYQEQWGVYGLRDLVMDLAEPCNQAWDRACARRDAAGEDPGSFDWDFIPIWLRECVDWSLDTPQPRVQTS
jgi:hypothetical protein